MSPQTRLWGELAEIAGLSEELIARLTRHAALCKYRNLKAGAESIALTQEKHLNQLRSMLASQSLWPRPPAKLPHYGANNWERFSHDLELLVQVTFGLHHVSAEWEGVDPAIGEQLGAIANDDDEQTSALRALALKCDPQALD